MGPHSDRGVLIFRSRFSPKPSAMQMAHIAIVDFIITMNGLREKAFAFARTFRGGGATNSRPLKLVKPIHSGARP
jgi:hypothetical protein